eukprot:TRINITY_DN817_c0_g1_i10.p1 TRINITY_DN817_c0_g1~~TRINITY_DN817_c0_g1_i10.p1  ORF type:complete len:470 (+),score=142.50 TRINITY_DN817_c0_g1_i10:74-1483(+)
MTSIAIASAAPRISGAILGWSQVQSRKPRKWFFMSKNPYRRSKDVIKIVSKPFEPKEHPIEPDLDDSYFSDDAHIEKSFSKRIKIVVDERGVTIVSGHKKIGKSTEVQHALKGEKFVFYVDWRLKNSWGCFEFLMQTSHIQVEPLDCLDRLQRVLEKGRKRGSFVDDDGKPIKPKVVFEHCKRVDIKELLAQAYNLSEYASVILVLSDGNIDEIKNDGGHPRDRIEFMFLQPSNLETPEAAEKFMKFYPKFRKNCMKDAPSELKEMVSENCDGCQELDDVARAYEILQEKLQEKKLRNKASEDEKVDVDQVLELARERILENLKKLPGEFRDYEVLPFLRSVSGCIRQEFSNHSQPVQVILSPDDIKSTHTFEMVQIFVKENLAHIVDYDEELLYISFSKLTASSIAMIDPGQDDWAVDSWEVVQKNIETERQRIANEEAERIAKEEAEREEAQRIAKDVTEEKETKSQ